MRTKLLSGAAIATVALFSASAFAQVTLFDNGPFSTGPLNASGVAAPAGTTWSELQSVGGVTQNLLGTNLNLTAFQGVDNFTITDPGGWQIDSITSFAYQTGGTTTSSITGMTVAIFDADPALGGTLIFGDTTTNVLASTSFSDIFRIGNNSSLTNRAVHANVGTVGTILGPGTYFVQYGVSGSLASGPFGPVVTIPGLLQKPGSDAQQFNVAGGTYAPIIDSGSGLQQDLPFIITGTIVPEPGSLALLGLSGLGLLRRRRA